MRQAFERKGFTWLFAGLTTSMFGDSVMLLELSMNGERAVRTGPTMVQGERVRGEPAKLRARRR